MQDQIDLWQENNKHEDYSNEIIILIHQKNNSTMHDLLIEILRKDWMRNE